MKKVFSYLLAGVFVFAISCQGGQKKSSEESEEKSATVEETPGQISYSKRKR